MTMKHLFKYYMATLLFFSTSIHPYPFITAHHVRNANAAADTAWTVIGAGFAGITVIGALRDIGQTDITWIDPHFNVGRMGQYYYNVPGNTLAESYITVVNECHTFKGFSSPAIDYLRHYYPYECCSLKIAIDALQDITTHLRKELKNDNRTVQSLEFVNDNWLITLDNGISFSSQNVVLATGSHPKALDYPCATTIPLDDALDKKRLLNHVQPEDTIALIGGSHSSMLVLKNLCETNIKRIINFYIHPITYAYDMGNDNIPDYNGLKGDVASWVFDVLEKEQPASIIRIKNTDTARTSWLPLCNKIIYAIGYERNNLPALSIPTTNLLYDDTTGFIAPRLFGIGIAFPEKIIDPWGKTQHTVGMLDFLTYAQRITPQWIAPKKSYTYLRHLEQLFSLYLINRPT